MSDTPTYVRGLIEALGQVQPEVENRTPDVNALVYSQQALARYAALLEQGDARIRELEKELDLRTRAHELDKAGMETMWKQLTACRPYLKDGETPAQRIERDHLDSLALMELLTKERLKYASHEAVCAGQWVPCSERLPEESEITQVVAISQRGIELLRLIDQRWCRGTVVLSEATGVTHWLDVRMPQS